MKKFLFICGPNGIGKTTVCHEIVSRLPGSAYVDSDSCRVMNPFVLNDETIPTIAQNVSDLIKNYLDCPAVETVIFSYGFHGRRKEVFERVINNLSEKEYAFCPVLLWCEEEENIRRMRKDNRSPERIRRAIETSRKSFDGVNYPKINITSMTVEETAKAILIQTGLL